MRALKGAGTILAGILGFVALLFFAALFIKGLAWVSENVLGYLIIAAITAFAVCVFVLLPCALFCATRKILRVWTFCFVRDFRRNYVDFWFLSDAPILGRVWCIRRRHYGRGRYRAAWDARLGISQ